MQRWLTIIAAVLSVALVGAGAPFASNTPSAVVFTLVPSGTASVESAARIAAAISARLGAAGTVAVKSAPGEVKQADFLRTAQNLAVDYYVSGFVAPLGSGFSVALQIVSTSSGAAIWSGTATLNGTDDVTDSAEAIGKVIVSRSSQLGYGAAPSAGRGSAAGPAPARPTGTASVPPAAAPAAAGASDAVAAAGSSAAATPNPRAGQTIAVLDSIDANGGMIGAEINYATDAIAAELQKAGIVATRWHRKAPALDVSGSLLCNDTKTGSVVEPAIYTTNTNGDTGQAIYYTVKIQVVGFDCATHALRRIASSENSAFNWKWAADKSIGDAVKRLIVPVSAAK